MMDEHEMYNKASNAVIDYGKAMFDFGRRVGESGGRADDKQDGLDVRRRWKEAEKWVDFLAYRTMTNLPDCPEVPDD